MNRVWPVLMLGFILLACNKVEKTQKTITGVWSVHQYKYTTATALAYFYESEGTVDFGSCDGELCNYSLNISYQNQGTQEKIESGTIELFDNNSFVLNRLNGDGTSTLLDYGRIILITKDELKLEFKDESGLHEFVLLK